MTDGPALIYSLIEDLVALAAFALFIGLVCWAMVLVVRDTDDLED